VDKKDEKAALALFKVKDFVGNACKTIASRIRGAVSGTSYEIFHQQSSMIIQGAVFGKDKEGNIREKLTFSANHLVITNVDIQSSEPEDAETRKLLKDSYHQTIEFNKQATEDQYRHRREKENQEAQAALDRQKIKDLAEAEKSRKKLLELKAASAAVETAGVMKAEAKAQAEAKHIEGVAEVKQVELKMKAKMIEAETEASTNQQLWDQELKHQEEVDNLEIKKQTELMNIDVDKFQKIIKAIGTETIIAMAKAGPECQAKLLNGLGLKGFLVMDGKNPINLFNTAHGFLGQQNN